MIKIGVTTRLDDSSKPSVKEQYYNFLDKDDITVIELDYSDSLLSDKMKECDGFLITGGLDINPLFYDEQNSKCVCYPSEIDLLDKEVVEYATKNNIPLLGICRGLQAINTFLGGSLYQDIQNHRSTVHNVKFDSKYSDFINFDEEFNVNSYHHQAIKDLSSELIPICFAPDGIIEAVIGKKYPILALQWHPERMNSKESKLIFDWFYNKVK